MIVIILQTGIYIPTCVCSNYQRSSLPSKVILPILRFVTSDLMCLPPDLDLDAISPTAPHMGRYDHDNTLYWSLFIR